jgi:anti-sigma-K factor RskA
MDIKAYIESGIVEQYVFGLCTDAEKAEVEQLRSQYPELQAAILQFENELEERMMKEIQLPSAATDEKILTALNEIQSSDQIQVRSPKKINMFRWKTAAAAAIILLMFSAFFLYNLGRKIRTLESELKANKNNTAETLSAEDYQIMKRPDITPVAMYGVGTHSICRCTMFWDKRTGKLYIMIHHLPQSSSSRDYQLWAMVDGKPVSIGIIKDEIRGRFIEMQNVPAGAISFSVTLENAGGTDTPGPDVYLEGRI